MNYPEIRQTIKVDFSRHYIPASVRLLKPGVYKEGRMYHCFLKERSGNVVASDGRSALEAMENWDEAYQKNSNLLYLRTKMNTGR